MTLQLIDGRLDLTLEREVPAVSWRDGSLHYSERYSFPARCADASLGSLRGVGENAARQKSRSRPKSAKGNPMELDSPVRPIPVSAFRSRRRPRGPWGARHLRMGGRRCRLDGR